VDREISNGRVDGNMGSAVTIAALNADMADEIDSSGEDQADNREGAQEQSENNAATAGVLNFHGDLLPAIRIFAGSGSWK
jgi:hypothetical protein